MSSRAESLTAAASQAALSTNLVLPAQRIIHHQITEKYLEKEGLCLFVVAFLNDALEDDVVLCLSAVVVSVLDPRGAHSFLAKKGNFCSDAST